MKLFLSCTSISFVGGCSSNHNYSDVSHTEPARILTIGTADSGGTMYPVGRAIAEAISEKKQNIKINISASNGSSSNVEMIMESQIDLGLTQKPQKGLRAIGAVTSAFPTGWPRLPPV